MQRADEIQISPLPYQRDIPFRREFRIDPLTGKPIIVIPGYDGDVVRAQEGLEGEVITSFPKNGSIVEVIHPQVSVFLLEECPRTVGDGLSQIYDHKGAYGAHEILKLKTQELSSSGLELMLEAIASRSTDLHQRAFNGSSLQQFHAYLKYDVPSSKLAGGLLASKEIAPTTNNKVKEALEYHKRKDRCLYCDAVDEEIKNYSQKKHRVVIMNGDSISYVPFAPQHQYHLRVMHKSHASQVTQLKKDKIENLADTAYKSLIKIKKAAPESCDFDVIYIILNSAPFYNSALVSNSKNDYRPIEDAYHFHIDIYPGNTPCRGVSYEIPGTGWSVIHRRPEDTAERLRREK